MSAAKPARFVKTFTAPEAEQLIGIKTAGQRAAVAKHLRGFMRKALPVLKTNYQQFYAIHKRKRRPCGTCAFAPKTWSWRGFLATTYALMESVERPGDKSFICHDNQPRHCDDMMDPKRAVVCMGFLLTGHDKDVQQAAREAHLAIDKVLGVPSKKK